MTESSQLKIEEKEVNEIGKVTVVELLDSHISDVWEIEKMGETLYALIEGKPRIKLVLDFTHVRFFSSAAIGKLISLNGKVKASNGAMRLCNIVPEIMEVFHVCKLDRMFDIHTDRADALSSIGS